MLSVSKRQALCVASILFLLSLGMTDQASAWRRRGNRYYNTTTDNTNTNNTNTDNTNTNNTNTNADNTNTDNPVAEEPDPTMERPLRARPTTRLPNKPKNNTVNWKTKNEHYVYPAPKYLFINIPAIRR